MYRAWRLAAGVPVILAGFLLMAASGQAADTATQTPPNGVTVSPAFQQVSISPAETQHAVSFTITNNKPSAQTFSLSAADFNTLGESGGLFFVGTNPTQLQKKYGLAKWFSLSQNQITLQPKQFAKIQANILNLPDLSPGGHYGALMIAADSQNQPASKTANKVAVHPIASSLLFVTKLGGDTHRLGLAGVTAKHGLFSLPASVTLRFNNAGNTHLTPRGVVTITAPGGKVVSKGIINSSSNIILPETRRQYFVPLSKVGSSNAIGSYKLHVDFRFDGMDQYRGYQQSIRLVPPAAILVLAALAALIVGLAKYILSHRKSSRN